MEGGLFVLALLLFAHGVTCLDDIDGDLTMIGALNSDRAHDYIAEVEADTADAAAEAARTPCGRRSLSVCRSSVPVAVDAERSLVDLQTHFQPVGPSNYCRTH